MSNIRTILFMVPFSYTQSRLSHVSDYVYCHNEDIKIGGTVISSSQCCFA